MAKILIVDDDPDVVEAVKMVLSKANHTVEWASNRADGMAAIQTAKPDLLILDIMMELPDDGITMAQELRKNGFDRPVLIMTSIAKVTGMRFGKDDEVIPANDFVEKPIMPSVLIEKVNSMLAN
jgi:DNA-binding response OmpR family regulator